jgi:hypothetical protein
MIMEPDPKVAAEMHHRASGHESNSTPSSTDSYQKYIYKELVKIRKWVAFFGVLMIITLIIAVIAFFGSAIDAAGGF